MDLIVIPSSRRAKRQQTLSCFERTGVCESYRTTLVVPEQEVGSYERASYKGKRIKAQTAKGLVVGVPDKFRGISKTREYVLMHLAREYGARKVFMVDDDLSFCHRPDINKPDMPYINNSPYEMHLMIETLSGWLDNISHVGLVSRQANRKTGIKWQEPGRMMNAYAYDATVIRRMVKNSQLELGRVPVMEDFDLTLQLLTQGVGNRVSCQFAWTQTSNMDGGCSTYRTAKVQADAARKLVKLHEPFVTLVEKKQAKTWKGGLTERVDVRVAWKKAYQHGMKNG